MKWWWNSYCYISSIKAINVGVRMKRYDGCQKEFVRRSEWWDTIEKALDAESILGSAPAPALENFSRGFRLLAVCRNLGFGVMPRNFSILGAIKERISFRTIMKFMHHDIRYYFQIVLIHQFLIKHYLAHHCVKVQYLNAKSVCKLTLPYVL